jgi:ketosteroid isomerase-like protein
LSPVQLVKSYFSAIERSDVDRAMACLADHIVQIEYPNAMKPKGDRRGKEALRADAVRGASLFSEQRYRVRGAVETGDCVAVQVSWTGVLAQPFGSLSAGSSMHVESAMFFSVREGKIVTQENYDALIQ